MSPKLLQCDGTYLAGSVTSHPSPSFFVDEQSGTPGIKLGQRRLSLIPSITLALWRFDGSYEVKISTCYTIGCTSGDSCKTWTYNYLDANGSNLLQTGQCTYRDTASATCANPMTLFNAASNQPIVQVGACPAAAASLAVASSSFPITAIGPLPGATTLGLSSSALLLNGTFAQAVDSPQWNLPANYTISAWINPSASNGRIVSQQNVQFWGLAVGAGGGLRHFDSREASGNTDVERGSGLVSTGWHLVHLVRRNAIDRRYYIDGRLIGTAIASSTSSFVVHPVTSTVEVGRLAGGGEPFVGSLDDIRILNNTLSDDDIMLEWNTQIHKFSSNSGVSYSTYAGTYQGAPTNGTNLTVVYSTFGASNAEPYAAANRWIFMSQSIDGESGLSGAYGITIDNSPPLAPGLSASPTSPNDITWTWGAPPRVCVPPASPSVFYDLLNATNNSLLTGGIAYPAATVGENIPGSSNQLVTRRLRLTDVWGSGLGLATSAYTLANPVLANGVVPSVISTGSALITWNQNGNPAYTRWLLAYSPTANFSASVSTPFALANDYKGSTLAISGLSNGTTYWVRVQAFSGRSTDLYGGVETVFVSTSFTTLPGAPSLSGLPLTNTSIQWVWTAVPGAQYYKLFDVAGSTLYSGGNLTFTQGGLTTNTQYISYVEAVTANGAGARASGTTFTLANDPTLPVVLGAFSSSITYSWNANLNPAYTFYELAVTTDATFAIVVTTLTVNVTTATATGLYPGTTYYARVRSINGNQTYGAGTVNFASAYTLTDPAVTTILAPPSAYVPPNGAVGQWQFDESTGTSASDSSGFGNTALLTCIAAACASTPTYSAGPAGLGSAIVFTGLANGLVRVPNAAQYAFNDDLTVTAWVNPTSLAQPSGAGIVVRGNGGVENFALEVFGGKWRFNPVGAFTASSTNTIAAGVWTHVTGVYDSVRSTATIYINGQPAATVVGVGARIAAAHDISIGNRQSAAASYDRGFLGSIDAVRVLHRALTPAEALTEYQGAFISTVTAPPPNNTILIGLAPNAFGAPATLFVSVDPVNHPITITPAVLNAGLSSLPTGYTLVPNSVIEIVPIVAGSPFTQTLGSSASISMPFTDANRDNIIDNTSPPIAASQIRVFTLNTTVNRWEALPSYVDAATRRVTVFTPHFSVFAMFAPLTIGTALSQVRVFPIPWRPGSNTRYDAAGITFDRLPVSGYVHIINLAGERVRDFSFDGSAVGSYTWDGKTNGNHRAASGVYFARITSDDGSTSLVKFAIER